MNVMTVAEALRKFEWEVLELSPGEFSRWCAYFKIREAEEKKAQRKASAQSKRAQRK